MGSFLDARRAGLAGNSLGAQQYGAHPSIRGKLLSSTNMERLSMGPEKRNLSRSMRSSSEHLLITIVTFQKLAATLDSSSGAAKFSPEAT